ncbi:hypothetical protein DESUT3_24150 [Desulfuromonas versatilis]|uniref:ABC-type glycine betaine transport system substrate-binding domain-containing protein n=1 Tax=Desulfuromonas versatilis TaxID=2802975 RepID=A0ABN6DZD9_9BACT|nr:hypothetical protein [Desulfuromonas versatilis]BCR05346.1 hypothetical protein DESUT3_24150 [Desulfuromonas versatilis]
MRQSLLLLLVSLLAFALPAEACFGPKLYLGTGTGARADVLYEVVSLYVKEKTGTESVRVELNGKQPLVELRAERVDMVFWDGDTVAEPALLVVEGGPALISGKRPLQDLQFTTVAPALRKLARLLRGEQVAELAARVEAGAPPAAAARRFLMDQGWI